MSCRFKTFSLDNPRGFTIIEMAIVLVIVGLLAGLGISLIGPLSERAKRSETRSTITAASEAIFGYATAYGLLPIWGDNVVDTTPDEFAEVVTRRIDAWAKPFYYFMDGQLVAAGSICGRKTTSLTICNDPGCTTRIQNVAFVLISGGPNYNPQTGIVTTGCPGGQTCIGIFEPGTTSIDNCSDGVNCPNYDGAIDRIGRAESFDDLTEWATLPELRTKTACRGPQLTILNNQLPPGSMTAAYNATIYAQGGVPFTSGGAYKWCVEIRHRSSGAGAPGGLTIDPAFVRFPEDAAPSYCSDQNESAWSSSQADTLTISRASGLTETGSFLLTVFVRDDNNSGNDGTCSDIGNLDNCHSTSLVLTVNP